MAHASRLDEWVDRLDRTAVTTTDSSLRRSGLLMPPTLHVLVAGGDPPSAGSLVCRPFEPGSDAAVAVAAMGVLPAVLGADRVVVVWEHTDLSIALERPGAYGLQPGLVVLDADRISHEVRFHSLRLAAPPDQGCTSPVVVPEWGPVSRGLGIALPEPVSRLLRVWRTQPAPDVERTLTLASLERVGYRTFWTQQRSDGSVPR